MKDRTINTLNLLHKTLKEVEEDVYNEALKIQRENILVTDRYIMLVDMREMLVSVLSRPENSLDNN